MASERKETTFVEDGLHKDAIERHAMFGHASSSCR